MVKPQLPPITVVTPCSGDGLTASCPRRPGRRSACGCRRSPGATTRSVGVDRPRRRPRRPRRWRRCGRHGCRRRPWTPGRPVPSTISPPLITTSSTSDLDRERLEHRSPAAAGSCAIHQWPTPSSVAARAPGPLARPVSPLRRSRNGSPPGTTTMPGLGCPRSPAPTPPARGRRPVQVEDATGHRLVDGPAPSPGHRPAGTPKARNTPARSATGSASCCSQNASPSPGVCQILAKSCHSNSASARPAASSTQDRTRSGRRLTRRRANPPPQSWPTRSMAPRAFQLTDQPGRVLVHGRPEPVGPGACRSRAAPRRSRPGAGGGSGRCSRGGRSPEPRGRGRRA